MSDALEYAKRAIKSEDLYPGVNPQILLLARAVVRQDEELTALKEKYRWRKQSEEPAPNMYEALRDIVEQAEKTMLPIPVDLADSIRVFGKAALEKAEGKAKKEKI